MRAPYGLEMIENCETCKLRKSNFFCQLSPHAMRSFDSLRSSSAYPEGAILFLENQDVRGVFLLCEGAVKLTISSADGKTLILRIAQAGEMLGLTAALAGRPYEVSAETLRPCQIAFIRRNRFLDFLAEQPEVYEQITKQLSSNYQRACEQLRTVGLSLSAPAKLARLLLEWDAQAEERHDGRGIRLPLTHEEIGGLIGSSRETVTRTLGEFRSRQLVTLKGSTLTIQNHAALEDFVAI
ncbi:MAG: Crp/Fnr family transcriptional regulator [Candidatus Acidiferrales bacterium]